MSTSPPVVEEASLYLAHQKVYPREVAGTFDRLRALATWLLLGTYYLLPWLSLNRHQAVVFDLPARKFHIFALTLWPQDFLYLSWLLILAALSLFFFTALAGRLWCGYACPQTVWTNAFMWMERLVEGDRAQRLKLDQSRWTPGKLWRKAAKQALWIGFAALTGFTFVGYFTPIRDLASELFTGTLGAWESFWIVFYGLATYGNGGYLREQVCLYMCPYARFQSAMFDNDTLVISYDPRRGEPRGPRSRSADPRSLGLGDCVDCTICVQVCPTGIDIRKGLQYECIACAACVDACDGVMDKMGYPRGLIRYATEHEMAGGRARILRPRIVFYGAVLLSLAAGFVVSLALRHPIGLDVLRDRNALYRTLPGGIIENVYSLRILNKDEHPHRYAIAVEPGSRLHLDSEATVDVVAGEVYAATARIRTRASDSLEQPQDITLTVQATDDPKLHASARSRFFVPRR